MLNSHIICTLVLLKFVVFLEQVLAFVAKSHNQHLIRCLTPSKDGDGTEVSIRLSAANGRNINNFEVRNFSL